MPPLLFWSGFAALAAALLSPLHPYGTALFFAHMIEHEIMMVVAVPLMVAARPMPVLLWGLPDRWRPQALALGGKAGVRAGWRWATDLFSATALHIVLLWFWHVPPLFEAAVAHESVHLAQHLSFVVSAVLFWVAVFDRDQRRYGQGAAIVALFLCSMQAALLGALLTFSPRLWFSAGPDPYDICGLTRFEDQELAGLIMWVPACSIYVFAALWMLARWLGRMETRHA